METGKLCTRQTRISKVGSLVYEYIEYYEYEYTSHEYEYSGYGYEYEYEYEYEYFKFSWGLEVRHGSHGGTQPLISPSAWDSMIPFGKASLWVSCHGVVSGESLLTKTSVHSPGPPMSWTP